MQKNLLEDYIILKLSFDFSLMVTDYCELPDKSKKYIFSKQLLRSGASIGAKTNEAQNGEIKLDFITRIALLAKEAEEMKNWLLLYDAAKFPGSKHLSLILDETQEVLHGIMGTAKRRNPIRFLFGFLFSNSADMFMTSSSAYQHISQLEKECSKKY